MVYMENYRLASKTLFQNQINRRKGDLEHIICFTFLSKVEKKSLGKSLTISETLN